MTEADQKTIDEVYASPSVVVAPVESILARETVLRALFIGPVIVAAAVAWLGIRALPVLAQPALWRGLAQGVAELLGVVQVILFSLLRGAGELVQQQPHLVAWMLVLSAVILTWAALYRRLVLQPGASA